MGDVDLVFQKACLIGAIHFHLLLKSTFTHCSVEIILSDVVSNVEAAIRKHEDLFEKLRWLFYPVDKVEAAIMEVGRLFHVALHHWDWNYNLSSLQSHVL